MRRGIVVYLIWFTGFAGLTSTCTPMETSCSDNDPGCSPLAYIWLWAPLFEYRPRYLYTVSQSGQTLSWYTIQNDNTLLPAGSITTGPGFLGICGDPDGRYVFLVAVNATGPIVRYTILDDGTPVNRMEHTQAFGANLQYCALNSTGSFVYVINAAAAGNIFAFRNDANLVAVNGSPFTIAGSGREIRGDVSGSMIYAESTTGNIGGFLIQNDGSLVPANVLNITGAAGYSVNSSFLYLANSLTNNATTIARDPASGVLTNTGLTTASPGSIAIRIASTLDGSGVLLTHQSSPDLRSYLSATDGSLSEQDVENCGNNSTASISYNGSMAYVSSLAGGSICVYTRTQNGQLAHIQTLTTTAPVSNYLLHRRIRLL